MISKKLVFSAILFALFILVSPKSFASAATYYACNNANTCGFGWITGNDTNSCNSKSTACNSIRAGILKMSGGDELIIGNGTYTGTINRIYGMPSGSAAAYTKIYAENDWGVILDRVSNDIYLAPIDVRTNYVEIRGFKTINHNDNHVNIQGAHHVKIIRCSSDGIFSPLSLVSFGYGSASSFVAQAGSQYVLFEECYAYGAGRYPFGAGGTNTKYIIFRRCVCRWDFSNTVEPTACFEAYDIDHVYFQNCIAIDGKDIKGTTRVVSGLKGFFTPNGCDNYEFHGCISLNMEGGGIWLEDSPISNIVISNSIFWDLKDIGSSAYDYKPVPLYCRFGDGPVNITNCLFGQNQYGMGVRAYGTLPNRNIKSSIIMNMTLDDTEYALHGGAGAWVESYNSFWNNEGSRNLYNDGNTTLNVHDITAINPFTNSLKYLTRIETGSALSGIASDGGAIGATILKKVGASGTLYGEPGWDTVTNENLWPFPNENEIKKDAASFYKTPNEAYTGSPEINGARGFAAPGNGLYGGPITLTSYIWEYLGNSCPADICNYNIQYHPADLNQNNRIEMRELIVFIGRWKSNPANPTLGDILEALGRWMSGN